MKHLPLFLLILVCIFFIGCQKPPKRVFYVNSYHQGYPPSDEVFAAIRQVFDSVQGIHLESFFLDSKRNPSPESISEKVALALKQIQKFKPDLIIASDDDAVKYLVVPFYFAGSTGRQSNMGCLPLT